MEKIDLSAENSTLYYKWATVEVASFLLVLYYIGERIVHSILKLMIALTDRCRCCDYFFFRFIAALFLTCLIGSYRKQLNNKQNRHFALFESRLYSVWLSYSSSCCEYDAQMMTKQNKQPKERSNKIIVTFG